MLTKITNGLRYGADKDYAGNETQCGKRLCKVMCDMVWTKITYGLRYRTVLYLLYYKLILNAG